MSWKENGVLFRTWTQSKTWHTEAELLNGREREKREGLFCVCLLVEKVFVANGANNNWGLRNLTVRFQNFQNFSLAGSPISITPKSQLHPSSCNNLLAFSLSLSLSTLHVFPERNIASYLLSILQLPHTLTLPCFQYFHSLTLILFLHIVFSISTRMGRVKLKIKKLESMSNRHVTYSKRKSGILKKAKELSILCDVEIVLLMFSPTGKATLLQGERSTIEEIIAKFAQLSPQERAKRKMESLEALKKTFKKLDHDVKIQDFLGSSSQTMEDLTHQVRVLQAQITEVHQRLSYWNNLEKINNLEHLRQMEESLRESINRVCLQKENLGKRQLVSLECASQLQEGMTLPMMMAGLQESQPLSWLLNGDNHQLMLPSEPKFLPFSDNTNRDAECSTDISLPGYSGYIGSSKLEVGSSPQDTTLGQGGGSLNELNGNPYLNVQQHCEQQFAYPPPPDIEDVKPHPTMNTVNNSKSNTVDYQVNNSFDLPRSLFENGHQFWNSAPGSCGIAMYNENGYPR